MYIYIYIFLYGIQGKNKNKTLNFDISATAFINSLLSTNHFSCVTNFKMNVKVIIYIIYINEPYNSDQ